MINQPGEKPTARKKSTLRLLFSEFSLPLLAAAVWTGFDTYEASVASKLSTLVTTIKVFGPAFFFCSWATGQVIRVRRQSQVETNLSSIESRLEAVSTRLEAQTNELLSQITGGDSFCFLKLSMFDLEPGTGQIVAVHQGKHPIHNAHATMVDLDAMQRALESNDTPGFFMSSWQLDVPSITPGHISSLRPIPMGAPGVRRFNILWSVRNGDYVQMLRLVHLNGNWISATIVKRDGIVLLEDVPDGFPPEVLGSEWQSPMVPAPSA